ncbi:MAG TPA: aldose 1-epimerase [Scandinavium sp.]|jgi:aldose 1-epimerase|uniref:aldose 1-epimerase n=1 Tax=Scandinavium sp. TaxID=2830653 RepID=UPI002E3094B9|nr:aldose 1-epimerase [Scandinavium sp.]HEX4503664.1 aldose 1-epimerase [Scandinavium sp.]
MVETLLLENAHLRMRVALLGAAVLSLDSLAYQQPILRTGKGEKPGDCGLFPMLPLANRVAGNRFVLQGRDITLPESPTDAQFFLHGDGWHLLWEVAEQSREHCLLRLRQRHACGFDYQAELSYRLRDNALEIGLSLEHLGDQPMLYGGGVHPYFHFTPQSQIQFSASGYWPEGESHLPLGWTSTLSTSADFTQAQHGTDEWLNVCYSGWNGIAEITHEQMSVTLLSPTCWLMLFRMPGEPFVCLEPQTHPVNAHNITDQPGLVMLAKGNKWRFSTCILVKSHKTC